jgi:hypothetical protein
MHRIQLNGIREIKRKSLLVLLYDYLLYLFRGFLRQLNGYICPANCTEAVVHALENVRKLCQLICALIDCQLKIWQSYN